MKAPCRSSRGFTLVEVLVALAAMAVIAALAWRGVDGMLRAREVTTGAIDRTARLQTVVTQWEQDVAALVDPRSVPALTFDGMTLRLVRESEDRSGVQVVAWAVRNGRWWRWTSPVTDRAAALQDHWIASQQLQGNEAGQLAVSEEVESWQVFVFRGGQLTNPQSSGDLIESTPPPPASPMPPAAEGAESPASAAEGASAPAGAGRPAMREALPEGIRLMLKWQDGRTLTRDLAMMPRS